MYGGFGFGEKNEEEASLLDFARAFGLWVANSGFPEKKEHLITIRSSVSKTQIDFLLLRKVDRALCKDCKVIPSEILLSQHKLLVTELVIKKDKNKKVVEDRLKIKWGSLTLASALEIEEKLMTRGAWESRGDVDKKKGRDRKLYRLAKARERKVSDLDQVKFINGKDGKVLAENALTRKRRIKVDEVKGTFHRMHRGMETRLDEIPIDCWKSTGGAGLEWLTRLFNIIFRVTGTRSVEIEYDGFTM
ncbi:uncharacterized protein LOC124897842 [Capsicum annuum]|uniref:uncharacterized protein LOC124897842 n=1 Tax=Capsicum annuum TaxID=4072 RepID=UPI001FB09112|nr:uncharacterized protein LOC124897842 [Capsicum annuum]